MGRVQHLGSHHLDLHPECCSAASGRHSAYAGEDPMAVVAVVVVGAGFEVHVAPFLVWGYPSSLAVGVG